MTTYDKFFRAWCKYGVLATFVLAVAALVAWLVKEAVR